MNTFNIRPLKADDWPQVKAIFEEGIQTKNATFETSAGDWEEWDNSHLSAPRIIAEESKSIIGWAALSPVSGRCVYGGVAEVSVYVGSGSHRKGIGSALLKRLVMESEQQKLWTLQAGIFPENKASIKLHEKAGFRIVGTREKIGKMDGKWRDVIIMERRSRDIL
jgi:L-amino acid N-acyltransferase YncA